ncbi:INCENP_ARK-bind domain-containing protein [Durusdinium trenchii]|uniref:INCENP_ARK-bind domain-containing protein n=1 Tax=Durusdinium trenchii TaxID=1381693 RepID=A0ABP0Q4N6_9DINO
MHAETKKEQDEEEELESPSQPETIEVNPGCRGSLLEDEAKEEMSSALDLALVLQDEEVLPSPVQSPAKPELRLLQAEKPSPGAGLSTPGPGPRGNTSHGSSSSSKSPSPAPHIKALSSGPRVPLSAAAAAVLDGLAQAAARPGGLLDAMRQRGTLPSCSAPSSSRGFAPAAPAVSSALSSPCSGADYYAVPAGEASVASPSEPRKRPREDDELDASPATSTSACSPLRPRWRSLPQAKSKPTAAKTRVAPKNAKVAEGSPAARKLKMKPPPVPCFKPEPEPWLVLREMQLPPKKAEENYEISDKGSDSEVEDERGHKLVPEWSLKYLELLQAQSDIDADTIFGTRVPTCDLEEVFKDSDYMKFQAERPPRRRGSSGEWRHDRLSREEISAYKRKTGQLKRWQASATPDPGG